MSLYLGIDPGLSGAIALVSGDGQFVMVEDMPLMARGNGRVRHEVDAGGIAHLLRSHASDIVHGVIEQVAAMPGQGVASMFSLGHSAGAATATLAVLGVGFELMAPAKWKRIVELPADKALVLAAARRRWPGAPLTRVKDHGRAEALFLALLAMKRNHSSLTNLRSAQ
jgi:crossover junction endodeoxyribonuclease RuvC